MQILNNKALQLKVRDPSKITTVIPCSKQIGDHEVLVRWGLEEAQVLKNMRIKNVPSPILKQYNWPGMHRPFQHQIATAQFLTLHRRAFCFNSQGTGKTGAAIWAADYLMKTKKVRRVLVICPVSIMGSAWQGDLFRFVMHRTFDIAHNPRREKRRSVIMGEAEFVIINYDGLEIVSDAIVEDGRFDLIIVDEANAYKNVHTKRWKTLNKIIKPQTWVWLMTGTPASQDPSDAYGLARLVNPNGVPKFFGAFRDQVMNNITRFKWIPKPNATEVVFKALQPAIRFTKEECLDLPDMMYVTRDVPLTAQQSKYYEKMLKDQLMVAAGEEISAVNAAANLNKLLQISGGAVYTDSKEVVEFDISPRLAALKEVLDETSNKVLVFVPFLHTIELVSNFLSGEGFTNEIICGEVSATNRASIINRFQNQTDPRVLVIQPQSAAHGITLTAADTIVFWSPVMSVETYLQCIGRIERVGQQNKMTIVHLRGSEVESRVYSMLQGKVDHHQKLVDLYKQELEGDEQ